MGDDTYLQYCLDRMGVFGEDDCRLGWQKAQQLAEGGEGLFAQPWSGHLTQFSVFGGAFETERTAPVVGGENRPTLPIPMHTGVDVSALPCLVFLIPQSNAVVLLFTCFLLFTCSLYAESY